MPPDRDIKGGKWSPFYRAHSYHTKVPPEAIRPLIQRHTKPGDVVLDPFCGSGMTGIAALHLDRRAILNDLSPIATFIAENCCRPPDPQKLQDAVTRLQAQAEKELAWLYETRCRLCRKPSPIAYTVWSVQFRCPDCRRKFLLWDVAVRPDRSIRREFPCPSCGRTWRKSQCHRAGWEPVRLLYDCPEHRRQEAPPSAADRKLIRESDGGNWRETLWYPTAPIPEAADEIARVRRDGVERVDQLFTPRNLRALAWLWQAASAKRPRDLRRALQFILTSCLPRASRTNKYIPRLRATPGPILGTMYLPGFYPEMNVLPLFKRKARDVIRLAEASSSVARRDVASRLTALTGSATSLAKLPSGSVDYVFTDPPFGGNIQYSELNLLWESWLGRRTKPRLEAVVSRSQGKSIRAYGGLMGQAFAEIHRVLKKDGRMTLVFHHTSGEVWSEVQSRLAEARFAVESIQTLDKSHQTFKQVTAAGAVGYDAVVTCRRATGRQTTAPRRPRAPARGKRDDLRAFLRRHLRQLPPAASPERQARKLHSRAIAHFLRTGRPVDFDYAAFRRTLATHFRKAGSQWYTNSTGKMRKK